MNKNIAVILAFGILGCGGSNGASGTNGTDATATKIASGVSCVKVDAGSGTSVNYQYQSVLTTSGDRFITCSVQVAAAQYTNTVFYKSTQAGAVSGSCSVYFDLDGASSGSWNFTPSQVRYVDATSGHNGYTYSFAVSDCTSY